MGGTGGGGSFSSSDMKRIQEAAEQRLKALASKSTKVLFVCEKQDRSSLDGRIAKSKVFGKDRVVVLDSSQAAQLQEALKVATFLIAFTEQAKSTSFIDQAIDAAMSKQIGGVHVKGNAKANIPAKVSAYRMRSLTWTELEAIFK